MEKNQSRAADLRFLVISILSVTGFVQIFEFMLLQVKYGLFSGGFIQPHFYQTLAERSTFIGLSLWIDIVLFGALGLIWFWYINRRGTRPLIAAYYFIFWGLAVIGYWLSFKFKLLTYFNDTINFLIIRNLGGGNLAEVLVYIANEASIFGFATLIILVSFWIGLRLTKKIAYYHVNHHRSAPSGGKYILLSGIVLITISLIWLINIDSSLRYGLKKKTSYWLISSMLDTLTDVDMDGYGKFVFPNDPMPFDSNIYPGALDIPENGIDEDGYGGDFHWNGHSTDPLSKIPPQPGDHVLFVVLESVRSELSGHTLEGEIVAPNITELAKQGSSVEYAYSHTGYTTPSLEAFFNRSLFSSFKRISLFDFLDQSGYTLSFISGQDESFGDIATTTGMSRTGRYLFDARSALNDRVYPSTDSGSLRLSEERVVREFIRRSSEVDWNHPQFFYTNLQAAHFPYTHPGMPRLIINQPIPRSEINEENRKWLEATYWNAVAVADQALGAIIKRLKELDVYEETLIIILSDHGESLFDDHFLGHGHALNQSQTRIPLIINRPGIQIEGAVGQTDVAELLIRIATDRFVKSNWNDKSRPIFQFVGTLERPQLIGTVSYGEIRTILNLETRKVFFSDLQQWEDFDTAWEDSILGSRTQALIDLWERARWENHLSKKNQGNR